MPNKRLEDFRVASDVPGKDLRRKLTNAQHVEIQLRYSMGDTSQRALAEDYGVSRRTIQFIVDPSKLEANRALRTPERVKDYNRKHTEAMRKHRAHKRKLMEEDDDRSIPKS